MGDVKAIEKAVQSLPPEELAEFRRWFAAFDAAAWDDQIERDASAGRLHALAAAALGDYRSGRPNSFEAHGVDALPAMPQSAVLSSGQDAYLGFGNMCL